MSSNKPGAAPTAGIRFGEDEKAAIVGKLRRYFDQELKRQIGRYDAEFLIDFFSTRLAATSTIAPSTMLRPSSRLGSMI